MSATLPGGHGTAVHLRSGQALQVINTHGNQVVDTWALAVTDASEHMSVEQTRRMLWRLCPRAGDELFSNRRNPMLRMETDTAKGTHDMLFDCCDPWVYANYGCPPGHSNCRENFRLALAASNLPDQPAPRPLNLWMRVVVYDGGRLDLEPPTSRPGDEVVLRALMDLTVVMSACPMDMLPVNGDARTPSDVHYRVLN